MNRAGGIRRRSREPSREREREEPTVVAPVPWFGRSPRRMVLFLWLVAFSHRLFLQLGSVDRSWPFPVFYEGDAETFHRFALSILAGQSYDGGIPFHPPLYPLFLAVCHALLGNPASGLVLRLAHGAVYALAVPLLWLWLRRYVTPGAALAAALLAAWSFGLGLISTAAVSEGLFLLLLLGCLLAFDRLRDLEPKVSGPGAATVANAASRPGPSAAFERPVLLQAVVLGLLSALLALTRAEGLGWSLLLLGGGAVSAMRRGGGRGRAPGATRAAARRLIPWGVTLITLAVLLTPSTIRNAVVLAKVNRVDAARGLAPLPTFVVTTAYGPLNFALANHEGAPGYFTRSVLTSGLHRDVLDLADPQHRDLFLHGYRRGWTWIRSHPGDFLALAGRKLALASRTLRLGWTQWDWPGGLKATRYPVDLATPDSTAAVFVHLVLILAGLGILVSGRAGQDRVRGRRLVLVSGGYLLFTAGVTVVFFGYARQGLFALALLTGVEGTAVAAAAGWLAGKRPMQLSRLPVSAPRLIAGIVAIVWMVELAGAFQARNFMATGETQVGSQMLNRDSIMYLSPKPR